MRPLRYLTALAIGGLLGAGCAAPGPGSTLAQRYEDSRDPDAITCRQVVKTGTRIGTRVCRKNHEWASDSERGRRFVENIQRSANMGAQPAEPRPTGL